MRTIATLIPTVAMLAITNISVADAIDKPEGIADQNWIAISESFGFVIDATHESAPHSYPPPAGSRQVLIAPPNAISAELMPPAKGYFVVKTETGWRRIAIM